MRRSLRRFLRRNLILILLLVAMAYLFRDQIPNATGVLSRFKGTVQSVKAQVPLSPEDYPNYVAPPGAEGCIGNLSEIVMNAKGQYYAPYGGTSELYDVPGWWVRVYCSSTGEVSFSPLPRAENLLPPGVTLSDVTWVNEPRQSLICDDGLPPQYGVWYYLRSDKTLVPIHRYETGAEFLQGGYLRFEGMNGDLYVFQINDAPSNPLDQVDVSNPGGYIHCSRTENPFR